MVEMEGLIQHYLFKLRQSAGVKRLIERQWTRDVWADVGQGFYAVEAELKLTGWSCARRVVVVRRSVKGSIVAEAKASRKSKKQQQSLQFADAQQPVNIWEYAVLITNTDFDLDAIGQLYRDRADCENGFDEMKNQWGWGGYTTQDMKRCNLSAKAVALVYNWWSWYVRLCSSKIAPGGNHQSSVTAGRDRTFDSQFRTSPTLGHHNPCCV
jgi:hypothetical protein